MGLLSSIFGKKPKRTPRSSAEQQLLSQSRSDLASLDSGPNRAMLDAYVAGQRDTAPEQARARGRSNADVMQATSGEAPSDPRRPGATPAQRQLTRARALTRMGWAGAQLADDQGFQSRLGLAQFGRQVQRSQRAPLETASDLEYQNMATSNYLSNLRGATTSNILGTLAGAGAAGYTNWRDGQTPNAVPKPKAVGVDYSTIRINPNQRPA